MGIKRKKNKVRACLKRKVFDIFFYFCINEIYQSEFQCFVAMVETLNNRLKDDKLDISDIGLV